jgi:hypothetical protein
MAYCATTRPIMVNTLWANLTVTSQIYITGVGGVAHMGLCWDTLKVVSNAFSSNGATGNSLSSHICATSWNAARLSYAAPQLKVKSNSNTSFVQFIFKKIVSEE